MTRKPHLKMVFWNSISNGIKIRFQQEAGIKQLEIRKGCQKWCLKKVPALNDSFGFQAWHKRESKPHAATLPFSLSLNPNHDAPLSLAQLSVVCKFIRSCLLSSRLLISNRRSRKVKWKNEAAVGIGKPFLESAMQKRLLLTSWKSLTSWKFVILAMPPLMAWADQ